MEINDLSKLGETNEQDVVSPDKTVKGSAGCPRSLNTKQADLNWWDDVYIPGVAKTGTPKLAAAFAPESQSSMAIVLVAEASSL